MTTEILKGGFVLRMSQDLPKTKTTKDLRGQKVF